MTTYNEHGNAMLAEIAEQRAFAPNEAIQRDLDLARTHVEDALTRYNSAQYRFAGTWKRIDPDAASASETVEEPDGEEDEA